MDDRGENPQTTLIIDGEPLMPGQEAWYQVRAQRRQAYDIGQQLNLLYDDIESGVFGPQAKDSRFYQYVKSIKQQFPKPGVSG